MVSTIELLLVLRDFNHVLDFSPDVEKGIT
jgi:hypothetical protein